MIKKLMLIIAVISGIVGYRLQNYGYNEAGSILILIGIVITGSVVLYAISNICGGFGPR
jgi:hypothetical protein